MQWTKPKQKAFTLIELLIVIAILGLLASIVGAALGSARAKGRDALRRQDMHQLRTALALYHDTNGTMPINQNPGFGYPDVSPNFLFELVNAGILSKLPKSPPGSAVPYYYYDYGRGNPIGALMVTVLEVGPQSTTGEQGTCRPWAPTINWCDQASNAYYCLCYPY